MVSLTISSREPRHSTLMCEIRGPAITKLVHNSFGTSGISQKFSLRPNWISRGLPALVIWPAVLEPMVAPGMPKLG